jgi:hypothetical protein
MLAVTSEEDSTKIADPCAHQLAESHQQVLGAFLDGDRARPRRTGGVITQ